MTFKKFLTLFLPFSILVASVLFVIQFAGYFKNEMIFAWICFGFFFIAAMVTYYFSAKSMEGQFGKFMNIYFAGILGKLIIVGILVIIYKRLYPDTNLAAIIPFAIVYFSFLIFETLALAMLSKKRGNN